MALPNTVGTVTAGSVAAGSAGGPATPDQAGNFVQVIRLHWRVIHPVSGQTLIDPLPHLHQSSFKVIYTQPGQPFDSAIGDFEIPLIPPDDETHFAWAKPFYDQLAVYQRVEAYLIEEDGQGAQGDPVFTGVITKLPQASQDYKIQGKDSTFLLTMAHTHRADIFQGRTDALFNYSLQAYQKTFGDDFLGHTGPINLVRHSLGSDQAAVITPSVNEFWTATSAGTFLLLIVAGDFSSNFAPAGFTFVTTIYTGFSGEPSSTSIYIYPNNPGGLTGGNFSCDPMTGIIWDLSEWNNVATATVVDTYGTATTPSSQTLAVTTNSALTTAGDLLVSSFAVSHSALQAGTFNVASGWTLLDDSFPNGDINSQGGRISLGCQYLINPPSGNPVTVTLQETGVTVANATGAIIALKPLPAGTLGQPLGNFINDGGWTMTTDDGLTAVKAGVTGDGLLYTSAKFANSSYTDCEISAPFHLIANGQNLVSAGAILEAGLIAAVQDNNNFILARIEMYYVNPTTYNVKAQIWQKLSGSYTNVTTVDGQLASPFNHYRPFLQLFGKQLNPSQYQWRLVIDGVDLNCVWTQAVALGNPTGGVGARVNATGLNVGGQVYLHGGMSGLAFLSKRYMFQPGNVGLSTSTIAQPIPVTKLSALIDMALTQDQWAVLKHPKAGLYNDVLDFNPSPAGDLSSFVRFEEYEDVIDFSQEPSAEIPATSIVLSGSPDASGQNVIKWYNLAAMDTYGVVEDIASATTAADDFAMRKAANAILSLKTKPILPKRVTVLRKKKHSGFPASPSGLRWREGAYIKVHVPSQGVYDLRTQIVGFGMIEGQQSNELLMEQYPQHLDAIPALHRLRKEMRHEFLRNSDVTGNMMDGSGIVADRRLAIFMNPFKAQCQNNANQAISNTAFTKVSLQVKNFDPNNNFDTATSRYTCPITGYYLISGIVSMNMASAGRIIAMLFKNGAEIVAGRGSGQYNAGFTNQTTDTMLLFCNPGDYIELWGYQASSGAQTIQGSGGDNCTLNVTFWSQ